MERNYVAVILCIYRKERLCLIRAVAELLQVLLPCDLEL